MRNKFRTLGFILIGIASLLIIMGIVFSTTTNNKKPVNKKEEKIEENTIFMVENKYKDYPIEKQIALILASDYIRGQANVDNLVEANYSDNIFSFKYIIKKDDNGKDDTIEINTNDFVIYNLNRVSYEGDNPNTVSISGYEEILYTTKNMVYDLAKSNKYKVGNTFSHKKMMKILDILKDSNLGEYIETVEDNDYKLKTYIAIPNNKVSFTFEKSDGSYLTIYNVLYDISSWNIYGVDSRQISSRYAFQEYISGYLIDKNIDLEEDYYNEIKKEIGTFLDSQ